MLKVTYRKSDDQDDQPKQPKPKKVKLYNNRAYMDALQEMIIRKHNEKIKAQNKSRT